MGMANTGETYDLVSGWIAADGTRSAYVFGYMMQTLKLLAQNPDDDGIRQQALDTVRAIEDHRVQSVRRAIG